MPLPREFDSRKSAAAIGAVPGAATFAQPSPPAGGATYSATAPSSGLSLTSAQPTTGALVATALTFARQHAITYSGFTPGEPAEFAPDPVLKRTGAGAIAVDLHQEFHGIPVFQMTRTVRFKPDGGDAVDAGGETAPIPGDLGTEPKLPADGAVLLAARHIATSGQGETVRDMFGGESPLPTVDITGFAPKSVIQFPLAPRPVVFEKGPFEEPIPANLVIFVNQGAARLGWYILLTLPGFTDRYALIVAADTPDGELLYSQSTARRAAARGRVYEFSPGVADRRLIDFPRSLADYPVTPSSPITGFPADWVDANQAQGNSVGATLNFTPATLTGTAQNGVIVFDPTPADGDDQKLLNIFYFCNYMHDFLYMLGFDEANGNFQQVNFTHTGAGADPVRARAHSFAVFGTANMITGPEGMPPVMNMGLVTSSGRHTAFDADIVFHEYTHGLTNRMVGGGRTNAPHSLEKLQSRGLGEGWSDFFALTIQNYFRTTEKTVLGDWVAGKPAGLRRASYDDAYPYKYGDLSASPDQHDIGEVWCAALMMMTRKLRLALGNDQQGYRLAWQIVVDGLKLTQANPSFLDARDKILSALDDLAATNRIPPATYTVARQSAWQAFAHFGMGANATSADADNVTAITADETIPPGV